MSEVSMETETDGPVGMLSADRWVRIGLGYVFDARDLSGMQLEMANYVLSFLQAVFAA